MTIETKVPGLAVAHRIITPTCRENRSNVGALGEAVERITTMYLNYVGEPANAGVNWHLVLTREAPDESGIRATANDSPGERPFA